jgi:hypothetical protein
MKLRGRVLLGVALAPLAAALAAPAGSTIVLQRSIAGVKLGMSRDQVKDKLGEPRGIKTGKNPAGFYVRYRYRNLVVYFQGQREATSIYTSRRTERTPSGIGVGSTRKQLKARIRGVHCRHALEANLCWVGALRPGRRVSTFYFKGNRIWQVAVGIVAD